jgi:hypothetical protein
MDVLRFVSAYEVVGDRLIKEIELPLSADTLRGIIQANEDDPDLFGVYKLNRRQFAALCTLVPRLAEQAFEPYEWFCECFSTPAL